MKTILLPFIPLTTSLAAGLLPIAGHVDIRWRWQASSGWTCEAVTDSNGGSTHDPRDVFLALSDKPYAAADPANSGARFTQPASAAFAFTGVPAGQPLWIAVQGTPGIGEAWPGLENDQPAGTFGSYIPADPRVSQTNARPWIRISLVGHTPPAGTQASFSLWTTSGSTPRVWMSTHDTSVVNDFYYAEGTHTHMNWGFSAPGIHRVRLAASAFAGPGATHPTGSSSTHELTFAIGPFAQWQATHFDNAGLDDPAVSGPLADPDQDGANNLLEFAFGSDPRGGTAAAVAGGLGLPKLEVIEEGGVFHETLTYPRRRAGAQLNPMTYQPQFAADPAGPWSADGVTTTAVDFPAPLAHLNAVWELATSRRNAGAVRPVRGFGRVLVSAGGPP